MQEYGGPDAKAPISKINTDFVTRISQFYRRSNVEWITLVLHRTKEQTNSSQITQLGTQKKQQRDIQYYFPILDDYSMIQPSVSMNDEKPYQIIFGYPTKPNSVRDD